MPQNNKPGMCNLSITLSCMLRCKICYHWQHDESQTIKPSLQEWKTFLNSLKGHVAPDFIVVFGGGEPLLFPEMLIELIAFSSSLGFRTSLSTSGHTITNEYARRLSESGLNNIDLTVFSLNPETHDCIRGIPGSLERVLRAINYLSNFTDRLKIGINTVIMKPSLHELLEVTDWVNRSQQFTGIYYQAITRPFHTPYVENWHESQPYRILWPDNIRELEGVIDALIDRKKSGYRIANAVPQFELFKRFFKNPSGFVKPRRCNLVNGRFFTVNSDGSLCMCPYLEPLGKVMQPDFDCLWNSEHSDQIREKIAQCKTNCHQLVNCWYEED